MKMTLHQRYVRWLTGIGYVKTDSRATEHVMYAKEGCVYYFVSLRGPGLRVSKTPKITDSIGSTRGKAIMALWEKQQGLTA